MIQVTPLVIIPLPYVPTFAAAAARSGEIVAFNRKGHGHLIAPDGTLRTSLTASPVTAVSIDPDGIRIAVAAENALLLLDGATGELLSIAPGKYDGCQFSVSGHRLWASRRPSGEEAIIELRTAPNFEVINTASVEDPYGESFFWLSPHPDESSVAIWAAAGQDGQSIFWATDKGAGITIERFETLNQCTPAALNSDGTSFLVIANFEAVHQYTYPHGPRCAAITWPEEEDEGDRFGDVVAFVGIKHALLQSANGLLRLVDLTERVILDDVVIVGHEPRPLSELYRTLSDNSLGTDLSFFQPIDQHTFLSIHRRRLGEVTDERSEILVWRLDPANYQRDAEQVSLGF